MSIQRHRHGRRTGISPEGAHFLLLKLIRLRTLPRLQVRRRRRLVLPEPVEIPLQRLRQPIVGPAVLKVLGLGLGLHQEHDDEKKQDDYRPCVDDHLNGRKKVCFLRYELDSNPKQRHHQHQC